MRSVAAVTALIALWACESNPGPLPVASVSVAPDTATIMVGTTRQLTATPRDGRGRPLNDRAITWESRDSAIATVSATGLVSGVGPGVAEIFATSEGHADTALITVAPPPTRLSVITSTTGIDLDANGYMVDAFAYNEAGGSFQTASIGLNDSVSFVVTPDDPVEVRLYGVAWNCTVAGENSRSVAVPAGQTMRITFAVTCAAFPNLVVTTTTTGGDPDPDGYQVVVAQDDGYYGEVVLAALPIGLDDSVTFRALNLSRDAGPPSVYLRGVARNCTAPGSEPVDLVGGQTTRVALAVTCVGFGSIAVTATTTGVELPNDYNVSVSDGNVGFGNRLTVNGTVKFGGLLMGGYTVTLNTVPANCSVAGGPVRTVAVTSGDTATVAFDVTCVATGSITVSVTTTGVNLDPDGYYAIGAHLPVNGSVTLTGVAPGSRTVTLDGVAGNCGIAGGARRTVTVTGGDTTVVAFAATCEPSTQIAFVWNGGIYFVNTDGTNTRQLISSGVEPAWSPDGTKLAFASNRSGNFEIYVMSAEGTGLVRLTTAAAADRYPAWSPDGTRIAFVSERDGAWQIYVMNVDGSGATRLGTEVAAYAPSWSPDGTRISFTGTDAAGTVGIYVTNADGSNVTRISNGLAQSDYPAWSPDGSRIAFRAQGNIYTMNSDGTGVAVVSGGESRPAWSPDGTRIALGAEDCYSGYGCWPILLVVSADGIIEQYLSDQGNLDPAWRPR